MAHVLIMPRRGNTVESCVITDWKVKEGDNVNAETTVCEVETDKAAFEVPAGAAGMVLKLLFDSGDDVPVLRPIAVIGDAGEDWQSALTENSSRGDAAAQSVINKEGEASPSPGKDAGLPPRLGAAAPKTPPEFSCGAGVSPRARKLAEKEALPLPLSGSGPGGRIIERDVTAALRNRPPLTAAARAAGFDRLPAAGSGLAGRVTKADLASLTSAAQSSPSIEGGYTETPIKGVRKIISDRMYKSLAESAQLTLNISAPVSKLQELRSKLNVQGGVKISVNDLVLFAVSRTLPRFPYMNAHLATEFPAHFATGFPAPKTGSVIRTFERVHLGMAVDTPRGLMVPVIRNADSLSLKQISSEAKRLASSCQDSSVNPDELSGSTFSISNLGNLGITSFTPILNEPEIAILGVCGIELKPVAAESKDGNGVRFEPHIGFSLTINHQVVDGAPAARFLKGLCETIANIDLLLEADSQ